MSGAGMGTPRADGAPASGIPDDITPGVNALYRYADPDSYVALRCFPQHDRGKPAAWLVDVRAGDLGRLVAEIGRGIHRAAFATDPELFRRSLAPPSPSPAPREPATSPRASPSQWNSTAATLPPPWRGWRRCSARQPWSSAPAASGSIPRPAKSTRSCTPTGGCPSRPPTKPGMYCFTAPAATQPSWPAPT